MPENALARLARLVGGVAMMQGGLGPQVLGQLLIAGTSELAVAGAAVMVAGTTRVKHPGAQFAIRTAAPAIAVQTIFARREELLNRRERDLLQREQALGSAALLADRNRSLANANAALRKSSAFAGHAHDAQDEALITRRKELRRLQLANAERLCDQSILLRRNQQLRGEKDKLQKRLDALTAALSPAPAPPAVKAKAKRAKRRIDTKRKTRKPKR
jgi:Skp family chaperone for outer membrane proteins